MRSYYTVDRIGNERSVDYLITNSNLGEMFMNAIRIDVSKGKSMVAIVQPFGVVVAEPFQVSHN